MFLLFSACNVIVKRMKCCCYPHLLLLRRKEKQIMKQLLLVLFLTLTPAAYLTAATVKGWVKDAQTGEELIGAAVYVKENPAMGTTAGLDGTFVLKDVPEGKNITLVCSYISYETQEQNVNTLSGRDVLFNMKPSAMNLEGVTIIAANPGRTEAGAAGLRSRR